ncbi:MAG: shikimate kinase [Candidatus Gastranaerophilales bacterium]|nr:shikimate kinase [Candidatus Gastranaerophilales bacterium]
MKNIVLVGLMGAGKSTVGKILADKLSFSFIDTDEFIEQQESTKITEIFAKKGETYFRTLENNVISKISTKNSQVISTGGGSIQNPQNLTCLKDNGFVVYLKASSNILFERIKDDNSRPLLKTKNPLKTLDELLKEREINYNKANFIINTDNKTVDDIINLIIEEYNENFKC